MDAAATPERLAQLASGIDPLIRAARIPGAAVAVVLDGAVVFAQGFGHRDVAKTKPVTRDTIYPIASTSKAFNATLIAMLVEEGRLGWDTPIVEYLTRFALADPTLGA